MSTHDKVAEIIAHHMSLDVSEIHDDSTLESLGMDSLDRVELVMKVEEEFDIEINDDAADQICKVSDFVQYVDQLKS